MLLDYNDIIVLGGALSPGWNTDSASSCWRVRGISTGAGGMRTAVCGDASVDDEPVDGVQFPPLQSEVLLVSL